MTTAWQLPNIHSPTGSIDSGVGLSPRTLACGPYDELSQPTQIFSDTPCPESPISSGGSTSVVAETKLGWSSLPSDYHNAYPEQLTADELEYLSSPDCLTPSPSDDIPEIAQFEKRLCQEEVGLPGRNYTQLDIRSTAACDKVETTVGYGSISRNRRKRPKTIKSEEAYNCLIPKKGTAKPRQTRKKTKIGHAGGAGAGGENMKKKISTGARVKETAREKLNRLRHDRREGRPMPTNRPAQGAPLDVEKVVRYSPSEARSDLAANMSDKYAHSNHLAYYHKLSRHSVEDILCTNTQFQGNGDTLDQIVNASLQLGDNMHGLAQHIQRTSATSSASGQTTFHTILEKLNQRKEQIHHHQIEKVTKLLCELLPNELNFVNYKGESPVYRAALFGNIGALRALVEANADLWIKERSAGEVALHAAIRSKNVEAVRIITDKAKQTQSLSENDNINTVAHANGNTPLHNATALRDVDASVQREIVLTLLRAGADLSRKNHTNEMAHALLPESLKDLQNEMKRLNVRKPRHHSLQTNARQVEPAFIPPSFHQRYPTFPPNFQGPFSCANPFGQTSQLAYIPDFHQSRSFHGMPPPHFPAQLDHFAHHLISVPPFGPVPETHPSNYRLTHMSDPGPQSPSTVTSEYSDSLDDLLDTFGPDVDPTA